MYESGAGVLNDAEAMRWFRLAAEQGHTGAQNRLGFMYAFGEGVLKDPVLVHMWYTVADANEHAKRLEISGQP